MTAAEQLRGKPPGYWVFLHSPVAGSYMHFKCPCGCKERSAIPVAREGESARSAGDPWVWNGDEVRPTLSPSLLQRFACKWHGHLVSGMWSACTDGPPLSAEIFRPSR